ncbi:DUF5362 family protein [Mucilaginibacter endophyticus]|uniref:DUF5362 family protein n=1 Tax=Mucilaginibacter endophyticus TaxID=2675003 RepID=UPI000E0D919E|nr:DUF5362 family protein [Mucilaginibacter endophyticus]
METPVETYEAPLTPKNELILTPEAQSYLLTSGKWATFLGILGFIFCGLFLLLALSMGTIMSKVASMQPYNPATAMMAGMGGGITVVYVLLDLLYFFFALYLYQFATKVKAAINFSDSIHLTAGLKKLKSFFKLWGIVTIVIIALYVLGIICVIAFAASMGAAMHQ